jgi:two-component system, NtrC family, nitrogen regulation response regulator GlnG
MMSSPADRSTADLSHTGQGAAGKGTAAGPLPALTVLFHPEIRRIGARALLGELVRGHEVRLSRLEPELAQPGALHGETLDDPHISRRPLRLRPCPGGVEILQGDSRTRIAIDGERLAGSRQLAAAELQEGVVLELADRVVLLLHLFAPPAVPAPAGAICSQGLVGESAEMVRVRSEVRLVADLAVPVLIRGETGAGKELVARAVHDAGPRRRGPFVSVNLGAIPPALAASELFGAARGAFTGAVQAQDGYFRRAHGGTLFLDEIGETPEEVQPALLRALETGEIQPVGTQSPLRVDVRIVAATDSDLERRVQAGTFRGPLLHRLAGYSMWLAPLRERRDDLGRLLVHFLRQELDALGEAHRLDSHPTSPPWLPPALVSRLARYPWPGNVRQLRNAVRQLVIGSRGLPQLQAGPGFERLLADTQPGSAVPAHPGGAAAPPALAARRRKPSDVPKREVLEALRTHRWNLKSTAEHLGISRPSLYALIEECPEIRKAGDLSVDEITRCHGTCRGELDTMVERLQVSRSALKRRIRELGLA